MAVWDLSSPSSVGKFPWFISHVKSVGVYNMLPKPPLYSTKTRMQPMKTTHSSLERPDDWASAVVYILPLTVEEGLQADFEDSYQQYKFTHGNVVYFKCIKCYSSAYGSKWLHN